jgi:Tfp pilus assembly protein PilO
MNLEFSQKAGAWLSVAILILVVGGYFGVYGGLNYLKNESEAITTQKNLYHQQTDRLEKLKDFESKLDQATETIALMNEALPTEEHRLSVVTVLSSLATRSGAKLVSLTNESGGEIAFQEEMVEEPVEEGLEGEIGIVAEESTLATQNLNVSIAGDYSKIKKFFTNLESNRRPLSPQSFQLSKTGMELSLVHYYLQ